MTITNQQFSTIPNRFPPIPTNSHRFLPIPNDSYQFSSIPTNFHRFQPIPTDSNRFPHIPTNSHQFQPIPTDSHKFSQILVPYEYFAKLSASQYGELMFRALNHWYGLDQRKCALLAQFLDMFTNSSLL